MRRCLVCTAEFADGWRCPSCQAETPVIDGFRSFAEEPQSDDEAFDRHSFELLAELEPESFWFRSRNRLIVHALERYFPAATSFHELGCGSGFVLQGIREARPHLELSGSELFRSGLEVAGRRLSGTPLFQIDGRALPFSAEFDVVGAFDVLEHIEEDERVLGELHRSVKPGGGVLITVPQHPRLWSAADDYGRHVRRYTRSELVGKLRRAGFRPVRVTSFVSLLLPLLALSRLTKRPSDTPYDPKSEYRATARVDPLLERVLTLERAAIRRGVDFPAGGSLLAVAQR
jgi:SAM-dependent methyltransferase